MSKPLEFTGERFVPGTEGEIAIEHWHRYAFARRFVAGRRTADIACGEGYGSAFLAGAAREVVGIDVDTATVDHARSTYSHVPNLRFVEGSAAALPLADECVDAIVSFETVEHLDAADQPRMIAEFARVLAPGGVLVLSSPNRPEYSDARNYSNPFHRCELSRDDLARLLEPAFPALRWYRQRRYLGSALWAEGGADGYEHWSGDATSASDARMPEAMYFVVVAARDSAALPSSGAALSLFTDRDDGEWRRIDEQAREVLRLDRLLQERDAALGRQAAHVIHLEKLVAERERIIVERDAQLVEVNAARERELGELRNAQAAAVELGSARESVATLDAERERLERAIAAQERIIAYRQSARWWIKLPWLRARLLWERVRQSV
jgi:SAM-dependent methyltransferase